MNIEAGEPAHCEHGEPSHGDIACHQIRNNPLIYSRLKSRASEGACAIKEGPGAIGMSALREVERGESNRRW